MRCSEPGGGVVVAIVASRAPGRWAFVARKKLYAFDPTLPVNNSLVSSAELRNQFDGLNELIVGLQV